MVDVLRFAWVALLAMGCIRPSDEYDVHVHSLGIPLDQLQGPPEPMGGRIELARYQLLGTNLGHGVTGIFSDAPRMDGTQFAIGAATFGTPRDAGFDRNSAFVQPGPRSPTGRDSCVIRVGTSDSQGFSEYVDVGDQVLFEGSEGASYRLRRDPIYHPRPGGESWYVGYGGNLQPVVESHEAYAGNWKSNGEFQVSFPGTVAPEESTVGAVPYPMLSASFVFPPSVEGLKIGDVEVRAPVHTEGSDDDVRFEGPWAGPMTLQWNQSGARTPLTVTLRYLGQGVEGDCTCSDDCGAGFDCEVDTGGAGVCVGQDGAGWDVQGEITCTVADDGEFSLSASDLAPLDAQVQGEHAVLMVSRMVETRVEDVHDVRTSNGKRIPFAPLRVRVSDTVVTRLTTPTHNGGTP